MRSQTLQVMILCTALLLATTSCDRLTTGTGALFQCPDGTFVEQIDQCPGYQTQDEQTTDETTATDQEETGQSAKEDGPGEEEADDSNITLIIEDEEEQRPPRDPTYINLNGWSVEEIIIGMTYYNEELVGAVGSSVNYDEEDRSRYRRGRVGKYYLDPFYVIREPYQNGNTEYGPFNLRTNLPNEPLDYVALVGAKHNDSKFKLLYPEQWREYDLIECYQIPSCRNIEAVECAKGDHRLYIWTHNTPGQGYTLDIRYTMQAMDDEREALNTFEQFYCTPI